MDSNLRWKEWQKKGDPHLINRVQWNNKEVEALEGVLQSDWFGYGNHQIEAVNKFSDFTGIPHVHLQNSGSAAIEVALLALKNQGRWSPGDKVIHPVNTFMTSISSAVNLGLVPIFIEGRPHTYVADPDQITVALDKYPETRGMILPHLLGNIPDMDQVARALGKSRFLIEDCCDTLGGTYHGRHIGSFGDVAAFSFYASHHVTSGGVGGAVATGDKDLSKIIRSLSFWGRDFRPGDDEFLKRYTYETLGLDSQMSAMQAAFLGAQLDKLEGIVENRRKQFNEMTDLFREYGFFHLPETAPGANPSWFSYPLQVRDGAPFDRSQIARYLTKNNVEVRPVMCGNITLQKPMQRVPWLSANGGSFPIAEEVEKKALFVPCWGMPERQKGDYYAILRGFLEEHK